MIYVSIIPQEGFYETDVIDFGFKIICIRNLMVNEK